MNIRPRDFQDIAVFFFLDPPAFNALLATSIYSTLLNGGSVDIFACRLIY